MKKCCICGRQLEGFGNNPDGAMWRNEEGTIVAPEFSKEDRCCDFCNFTKVIPARLKERLGE